MFIMSRNILLPTLFLIFVKLFQVESGAYNERLSLIAYNLSASAYADDNEENIMSCLQKSFPNSVAEILHHSTFQCDSSNSDTCGGVYANFDDIDTTVIAFRGTKQSLELIKEAIESLEDFVEYNYPVGQIQKNFGYVNKYYLEATKRAYTSFLSQTINSASLKKNIIITGHSLGGALATLLALQLALDGIPGDRITVITFGEPRIGDYILADNIRQYLPNVFRVTHYQDMVPHYPPCSSDNNNGCLLIAGKPYHHPQEIWYNKYEKMTPGVYVGCNTVNGEDNDCSDKYFSVFQSLFNGGWESEHMDYFGQNIRSYGAKGCNSAIKIRPFLIEIFFAFIFYLIYHIL